MSGYTRKLVLTAVFAALAYSSTLALLVVPNVKPVFYFVFLAGYSMGATWGLFSGALSFFLISAFSPIGMAPLPLLAGQVALGGMIGGLGAAAYRLFPFKSASLSSSIVYAGWGLVTGVIYMGGVSLIDAALYGPFRERLLMSAGFSVVTFISNPIIFIILAPLLRTVRNLMGTR